MTKRVRLEGEENNKSDPVSLYDLPKDILVYMLSTLEQDIRGPLEARITLLEDELGFMRDMCDEMEIEFGNCSYAGCPARGGTDVQAYSYEDNCEYIDKCEWCEKDFCDKHLRTRDWDGGFDLCVYCKRKVDLGIQFSENDQEGPA